jgi:hypothetical protein
MRRTVLGLAVLAALTLGCGGGEKNKNKDIDRPAPVGTQK